MVDEFKKSVVGELEKRFKNPFFGAFLLSWIFYNWKLIYVIIFLDEKYVSLIPVKGESINTFVTKYDYIIDNNLDNILSFFIFPFISSILLIIFIEWITTYFNIFVRFIKNKIENKELLTKEESNDIKRKYLQDLKQIRENETSQNEEILVLQSKIDEYKASINDKVNIRVKEIEKKNVSRINELENDLKNINNLASDRLEKNNLLQKDIKLLSGEKNTLENELHLLEKKYRENRIKKTDLEKINIELNNKLSDLYKPLDESYISEYNDFKKSSFFKGFGDFIDEIEKSGYGLENKFYSMDLKYLKVKGIIIEIEENDNYGTNVKTIFTEKGNKFVEMYLDEFSNIKSNGLRKIGENNDYDINVEDIPF